MNGHDAPVARDDGLANRPTSRSGQLMDSLTAREREVGHLLVDGSSNREIANHLVLSVTTVKKRVLNLCGKLGVQSRAQAITKARMLQLV